MISPLASSVPYYFVIKENHNNVDFKIIFICLCVFFNIGGAILIVHGITIGWVALSMGIVMVSMIACDCKSKSKLIKIQKLDPYAKNLEIFKKIWKHAGKINNNNYLEIEKEIKKLDRIFNSKNNYNYQKDVEAALKYVKSEISNIKNKVEII